MPIWTLSVATSQLRRVRDGSGSVENFQGNGLSAGNSKHSLDQVATNTQRGVNPVEM